MLHFFTNLTDVVIAEDLEDAVKLWEDQTGEKLSDYDDEWRQMPDDEEITLWIEPVDREAFEAAGLPKGAEILEKKVDDEWGFTIGICASAKSWVEKDGRCFWGSSGA